MLWHNHGNLKNMTFLIILYGLKLMYFMYKEGIKSRSQWPRGLRRGSKAARLLKLLVRIPLRAWIFVCCVWSGGGLWDELITPAEESYRLCCVVVCDLETSRRRRHMVLLGSQRHRKKGSIKAFSYITLTALCFHINDQAANVGWESRKLF